MNPAEFRSLARTEEELWWFRGMRRILFRLLDDASRSRKISQVLEAGCGTGLTAELLATRYGWSVTAADIAWEGISLAGRRSDIQPVQADIRYCPFASNSFDMLLSLDVLVHFERGEEMGAISEFGRVLRRGGLLVLRTSALDWLRSRHSDFTHERQRFTRSRLRVSLERCGFRVLRSTYANTLLLPVAAARFRIWEPLLRKPPASGTEMVSPWLNQLLSIPLAIERSLIRYVNFPLGQTLIVLAEKQ